MTITITPVRAAVVALVVGALVVAGLVFWRAQGQDEKQDDITTHTAPYDDPQAAGLLTLCSADGEPVTGGSTSDTPFVDVALGETAVPSELDPVGAVATLFAYQPREAIGTNEFSGVPLSAAALLADPEHPAVPITADAWSLGDFVTAFPATLDGFVQLRLYLGTADAGTLSDRPYDTADLRVDGDRWELVQGGDASCADASSLVP